MKKIKIKYDSVITIENIECIYKKIKRNVRNKNKIILFEDYYSSNISKVYEVLKNKTYDGGKYYLFSIYEPKKRLIMSQGMNDKIINHFISEYYLRDLEKSMINSNVATRKGKGTKLGVTLLKKYLSSLELSLNHKTCMIPKREGLSFLGYRFEIKSNQVVVSMSNQNKRRVRKHGKKKYLGYIKIIDKKKYKRWKK